MRGTVAAAQNAVLNLINGDPVLASALAANPLPTTGGVGFQAMPVGDDSPAAMTAASQFGASLHQIGTVFNAAENLELGGDPNHLTAIQTGLMNMLSFPTATSALAAIEANESPADAAATTAHLQTVLALQIQHDNTDTGATLYAETHANILAIIDTIHGDPALDGAVGGPHGNAHGELNVAPPHGVAEHFWLHHV